MENKEIKRAGKLYQFIENKDYIVLCTKDQESKDTFSGIIIKLPDDRSEIFSICNHHVNSWHDIYFIEFEGSITLNNNTWVDHKTKLYNTGIVEHTKASNNISTTGSEDIFYNYNIKSNE